MNIRSYILGLIISSFVPFAVNAQVSISEFTSISETTFDFFIDINNDPVIVGGASHVFVGRVTKNLGLLERDTESIGPDIGGPYTRFEVEVLRTIKSELPAKVIVRMPGGITTNGVYSRIHSANRLDPDELGLLKVGGSYAFLTTFTSTGDLGLFPYPKARKLISKDANASSTEILKLARPRTAELIEAYTSEVVFPRATETDSERRRQTLPPEQYAKWASLKKAESDHRTQFEFKSLSKEKQQQLKDEAGRIRAELAAEAAAMPPAAPPKAEPLPAP